MLVGNWISKWLGMFREEQDPDVWGQYYHWFGVFPRAKKLRGFVWKNFGIYLHNDSRIRFKATLSRTGKFLIRPRWGCPQDIVQWNSDIYQSGVKVWSTELLFGDIQIPRTYVDEPFTLSLEHQLKTPLMMATPVIEAGDYPEPESLYPPDFKDNPL